MSMTESGLSPRATQRKLVLPDEKVFCPMTTIGGARAELPGHDEDDVMALIEEKGGLTWAWHIELGKAKEVRILTRCVECYKKTGKPLQWGAYQVEKEIFHGWDKPFLSGTRVRLILNCCPTHVINLIEAKELRVLPGTTWNTGPNGSPVITRDSFRAFLTTRRFI